MTLHGHTRIELTDVHTGAVEVVESDNLITNAVSDIFNGYGGSLNKAMLLWRGDQGYTNAPKDLVTMFYGGLLLYDTPLGSDPLMRSAASRFSTVPFVSVSVPVTRSVRVRARIAVL